MNINIINNYIIVEFTTLDSTNNQALRFAKIGELGPMVIFTKNQKKGKGRNGNIWLSSNKNLTATILISRKILINNVAQLAFVIAIAVYKTICEFINFDNHKKIKLKWPNDILVNNRKLVGILIETFNFQNNNILLFGIGINIKNIPNHLNYPAISMLELGAKVKIKTIISSLIYNFSKYLDLWKEGKNFLIIRNIWLKYAMGIGKKITVKLINSNIQGIFEEIDKNGNLILRDKLGKIHKITSGDIFINHI